MHHRRIISLLVPTLLAALPLRGAAADTSSFSYSVYFRLNDPVIDRTFAGNGAALDRLLEDCVTMECRGASLLDTVYVRGTASPDGPLPFDEELAHRRVLALRNAACALAPALCSATFVYEEVPKDWGALESFLCDNGGSCPDRDFIVACVRLASRGDAVAESLLRRRRDFYAWLRTQPDWVTRSATLSFRADTTERFTACDSLYVTGEDIPSLALKEKKEGVARERTMLFAFTTNLLLPLTNIGLEVPIERHHSVGAEFYTPWFLPESNRWCCELQGVFLRYRYWFGGGRDGRYDWTRERKLVGHSLGMHAGAGQYDFQKDRDGMQGEYVMAGLEWTYAAPVAKGRLRMEFSVGVGYMYNRTHRYTLDEDYTILIKRTDGEVHWFGPTYVGVSFIVPLYARTKGR